jgi:hypothetical protein
MLGPKSGFGSTHYARSRSRGHLDLQILSFQHGLSADSYWGTPDQCAVKERLNARKTIYSLLGHRRRSEALNTWECDKGCCSLEVDSLAYLVKVM